MRTYHLQRVDSPSLRNKVWRALWKIAWLIFFRPSPRPFHIWRCTLLRIFGANIGKNVRIYQSARIWAPWNLEMGDNSCLGDYVDCYCVDKIIIHAHATVSQYCFVCTASHDYSDCAMPLVTAPISIGKHAWITADVFIAPGVSIGEGSVILARSSVFQNIEPWIVAAGNPAKPIKPRTLVNS